MILIPNDPEIFSGRTDGEHVFSVQDAAGMMLSVDVQWSARKDLVLVVIDPADQGHVADQHGRSEHLLLRAPLLEGEYAVRVANNDEGHTAYALTVTLGPEP